MSKKKLLPTKLQRQMRARLARYGISMDVLVQRWNSIGELLDKLNKDTEKTGEKVGSGKV